MNGYTIMAGPKRNARPAVIFFAILAMLIIGVAQFLHGSNTDGFAPQYFLVYGPGILLILAGAFRSYFFFLLSIIYYTLHQLFSVIFISLQEGAYTSYDGFETFTEYALLFLGAIVTWQALLFFFGHADHVAMTHTCLLFTSIALLLTFLPYIVNLFLKGLYITDSYNVFCLGLSMVSFVYGLERQETPTT